MADRVNEQAEWKHLTEYDRHRDGVVLWWKPNPASNERPYVGTTSDMHYKFHPDYRWWTRLPDSPPPLRDGPREGSQS